MQRQRRILFLTLLGTAVAVLLAAGPAAAEANEPGQDTGTYFLVNVLNNDGGTLHADEVELLLDGTPVPALYPSTTGADPASSEVVLGTTGPFADSYTLDVAVEGYVTLSTCTYVDDPADSHLGDIHVVGSPRNLVLREYTPEMQCIVLLDDVGATGPTVRAAIATEPEGLPAPTSAALLVDGAPLTHDQTSVVERSQHLLSAAPVDGFDSALGCTVLESDGVYGDRLNHEPDGSLTLNKISDDSVVCTVTYTAVSTVEVTIEERIYNTYGGTLELGEVATMFNGASVESGDVVHVSLNDLAANEQIAFSSNTPDGYAYELECFHAASGENVYLGYSVDPWRWPGLLAGDLSAGDELHCVNAMLEAAPETHSSEFIVQAVIINNDGGTMTPRDAEIQINGAVVQPSGWRSVAMTDARVFAIFVEDVGTYELTASYLGYHVSVQCTDDNQGWDTKSFGPAPASIELESLAFNGCVVFFDDIGPLAPRLLVDVAGDVVTQNNGGLLAGETLISNGETIDLEHSTSYTLVPVQLAGFISSFWCPSGDMDFDDTLLHVYRDILIECTVTYTAVETRLTVDVEVVNNHGGTLEPSDFWTVANLPNGSQNGYVYSEVDSRYKRLPITCSDDASGEPIARVGSRVALDPGQQVTCTVVYDDRPAGISFATSIDDPTLDARLALGNTTTRSGQYRSRDAGEYVLDARPLAGYAFVGTQCVSGGSTTNVVPGESHRFENGSLTTCTYHFEPADQPVRVLFNVEIINDDQGIATASTPRLTFGEITTRSGQFRKTTWGQRSLGALPLAGYELRSVNCTDRFDQFVAQSQDGEKLLAAPGHWLTCTYTFDDIASD